MKLVADTLDHWLNTGNVSFFGYRGILPHEVATKRSGRVRAFVRSIPAPVQVHYERLGQIREEHSDVYFLDGEATRVLFAEFPPSARYVLVRLIPRASWFFALPGLLRRLRIGLVSIEGVRTFGKKRWLVVRHNRAEFLHTRLCLSDEVGIAGLLSYARKENLNYVVLRFFDALPQLHRKGGDLDILVSDEDEIKLKDFLKERPGPIGVDVWTVSRVSHNAITYYPPPLARTILENKISGPAGALIPAPREAFLSFAYHALYHKGLFSGVPTTIPGLVSNPHPENDYAGELMRMAKKEGIDVQITLESIDDYLAEAGWRPQLDTLAKIAPRNKWVWHRFFAHKGEKDIGLSVIIFKQKAKQLGLIEAMLKEVRSYDGTVVLRTKELETHEVPRIAARLRGGVWDDASGEYLPAYVVVTIDTYRARVAKLGLTYEERSRGIKHLKKRLRSKFDQSKVSFTHATDYTHEAWEYVEECFPDEVVQIRQEVGDILTHMHIPLRDRFYARIMLLPKLMTYRLRRLKDKARRKLVSFVVAGRG